VPTAVAVLLLLRDDGVPVSAAVVQKKEKMMCVCEREKATNVPIIRKCWWVVRVLVHTHTDRERYGCSIHHIASIIQRTTAGRAGAKAATLETATSAINKLEKNLMMVLLL